MSKAKKLLEALVRTGMVEASIEPGCVLQRQFASIEDGRICTRSEYLYTYTPVVYIEPNCIAINFYNEKIYLYQI